MVYLSLFCAKILSDRLLHPSLRAVPRDFGKFRCIVASITGFGLCDKASRYHPLLQVLEGISLLEGLGL